MDWFNTHLLTVIVFLPLVWGLLGLALPVKPKFWTLLGSLLVFGISILLYTGYDAHGLEFQFLESAEWISGLGISYQLGMDGISLWLILLTTFLTPIVILASFSAVEERVKEYYFF